MPTAVVDDAILCAIAFVAKPEREIVEVSRIVRNARDSDQEPLRSISYRTIRSSYIRFLGEEAVEAWLGSGAVETYFDENLPGCRVIVEKGDIVGFSVVKGNLIDLMMIDCSRHREGLGRTLLAAVEAELFIVHPLVRLESFAENTSAKAFYVSQGWTPGKTFDDPDAGVLKTAFDKKRSARAQRLELEA